MAFRGPFQVCEGNMAYAVYSTQDDKIKLDLEKYYVACKL
jgi:hypothetical protein